MEFPSLGEHCQNKTCNQIDFLPLQCKCGMVFCGEHFNDHCQSGNCEMATMAKEINFKIADKIYRCSASGCKIGNLHQMVCRKCSQHYCIEHRFHKSCPEIDDEIMEAKIEQYDAPRRQFMEANKFLQEKITENIRKALQSSAKAKTAAKIHLMRIKQKAIGPKSIPPSDRVYFAIKKPKDIQPKDINTVQNIDDIKNIGAVILDPHIKDTVPVFISTKWSLGHAIDSICESCNIRNENNKMVDTKLRLFRQLDGYCVNPSRLDVLISELLTKEVLIEGDKLIIEYIDSNAINSLEDSAQIFLTS